ncbi:hypothetical protein ACNQKK_001597 [Staphylococcus pseudintermedius]
MENNIKFDILDWFEILIGTILTLGFFMLNCLFLFEPIKWLLVQMMFIVIPATYGTGKLIRYFFDFK